MSSELRERSDVHRDDQYRVPSVAVPSEAQLAALARDLDLNIVASDPSQLDGYKSLFRGVTASVNFVARQPEPNPLGEAAEKFPRGPGRAPRKQENGHGAWAWRCNVAGSQTGTLAGKKIAVKDNVYVAGIPLRNGSRLLDGFIPGGDATVVTRILEAGGNIVGKAASEDLCLSGSSFTGVCGPIRNAADPLRVAGGSSGGSAVLVATGEVDMAIACDQGGSIRIPSAFNGVVGLKPTHGLVPYTGIMPMEITLDHAGPVAKDVKTAAQLLDVIAGPDGLDPRQYGPHLKPFTVGNGVYEAAALNGMERAKQKDGFADLRIGVLLEGFSTESGVDDDVSKAVRQSVQQFAEATGAQLIDLSIPAHRDALHVWNVIGFEGMSSLMFRGNCDGTNWKGHHLPELVDVFSRARVTHAEDMSVTSKLVAIAGEYLQTRYGGRHYAKAQNLARAVTEEFNTALQSVDILVMPTLPFRAPLLPTGEQLADADYVSEALGMIVNTAPFDVTGHPALTVDIRFGGANASVEELGLPTGAMFVGRHCDEEKLLAIGAAFEYIRDHGPCSQ